jgi:leader peptidase (prepilin peptidase)/N-methyltransferase
MGDMQPWAIVIWGVTGLAVGIVLRQLSHAPAAPAALECITGALFAILAWRVGPEPHLLAYSALAAVSVPLATIDFAEHRLPNQLILPAYPAVLGLLSLAAVIDHNPSALVRSVTASTVLVATFGLPGIFCPGWMSGGDAKLAGLLGLMTGWASWNVVLTALLLCWVLALLGWVMPVALHNVFRPASPQIQAEVPLGPFLITGAFTALLLHPH